MRPHRAFAVPFLAVAALAGLEDAKHSIVLTAKNFDSVVNSATTGTLTVLYAPWCGHCKSLQPVWEKVGAAFEGDDNCKIGHLDADNSQHKGIAARYGVSGFPTIKFIPPASSPSARVEDYNGARTEAAFLEYLNDKCGSHRLPGGLFDEMAGRIPGLDKLASTFFGSSTDRSDVLLQAQELATKLGSEGQGLIDYYIKVFTKFASQGEQEIETGLAWVAKEKARLTKLAARKGAVAGKKLDETRMKANILAAFEKVQETVEAGSEGVKSAVKRATGEL